MIKLICTLGLVLALGCGGGKDEDFENAKVHKCNLEKQTAAAAADPDDKSAAAAVKETTSMLEIVIDGASDKDGLRKKLAAHKCK